MAEAETSVLKWRLEVATARAAKLEAALRKIVAGTSGNISITVETVLGCHNTAAAALKELDDDQNA